MDLKSNPYSVEGLFPDAGTVYFVPKYQREYTWGKRDWAALLDDLIENDPGYFLGSMVTVPEPAPDNDGLVHQVIDGQQRLTTLSLLMAALFKELEAHRADLSEDELTDFAILKRRLVRKNDPTQARLTPQDQNDNRADYFGLLAELGILKGYHSKRPHAGNRQIYRAFRFFADAIARLGESPQWDTRGPALFDLLKKLNQATVVLITTGTLSDAHMLFEALNNRGVPLSPVDLVKNFLLAALELQGGEQAVDEGFQRWGHLLVQVGDEVADHERFFRHHYNAFRDRLNEPERNKSERRFPLGDTATKNRLPVIYERLIKRSPLEFLDDISASAEAYAEVSGRSDDGKTEPSPYLDLTHVQGAPGRMLLLWCSRQRDALGLDDFALSEVARLLVLFFVRRNLTDSPPTHTLDRGFQRLIERLEKELPGGLSAVDLIRDFLRDWACTDAEFEDALRGDIYSDSDDMTRFVLAYISERKMTKETWQDLWQRFDSGNQLKWSIEHILPQGENLPDGWVKMIALGDRDEASRVQAEWVHRLGNLTITAYNTSLSNYEFLVKRDWNDRQGNPAGYRNGLWLNDDLRDEQTWTPEKIALRTERLVAEALRVFSWE